MPECRRLGTETVEREALELRYEDSRTTPSSGNWFASGLEGVLYGLWL